MFDFFRNSWMVEHVAQAVPVPRIRHLALSDWESGAWEETPWLTAAGEVAERSSQKRREAPWWAADDSDVMDELYEADEDED
jgi:hypothetical protein